ALDQGDPPVSCRTNDRRRHEPRPLPKINETETAAFILGRWQHADGTPIPGDQATQSAFLFHHHLKYQPVPAWLPPRPRTRPGRPTARRLEEFLAFEADRVRRTPDVRPVR